MNRFFTMILVTASLAGAGGKGIAADGAKQAGSVSAPPLDLTIDLPSCKQDLKAWKEFSPHARLRQRAWTEAEISKLDRLWRKKDAVDITWVDIDGDGWCDAITSGSKESYKNVKGKPVLLREPRAIYLRTPQGFKPFKPGMITSEYEGTSFVIYWDKVSRTTVIYKRTFQGNLVGGGGDSGDEYHVRQMLRASFAARKIGNVDEEGAYYDEADPFLYKGDLPRPVAERIWNEEAERAGLDLPFPYGSP